MEARRKAQMIKLLAVIAIAFAVLALAYDSGGDGRVQANDSRIETGWNDLDVLLEDGLSEGTHSVISNTLTDSAGFLRGGGDGVVGAVQEFSEP